MGGTNPYIVPAETTLPQKKYKLKITGPDIDVTIEVDPEKIPYNPSGLPGSILDIALGSGLDLDHACGGVCACSTCHVVVTEGAESCNESNDDEDDQLDNAPDLKLNSRLSCQCVPDGTCDITIVIPEWNRNLVQEDH